VVGYEGNKSIIGGFGNDHINGMGGDDILHGGFFGDDILNGGAGNDTLGGGLGLDTFTFSTLLNASTNLDTVTDFVHGTDLISLAGSIFTNTSGTDSSIFVSGAGLTSASNANEHLIYDTDTGMLYYDEDGMDGQEAVAFANFSNKPILDFDDFIHNLNLVGTSGDDTLIGGMGDDILNGGDGNDTYILNVTAGVIQDSSGIDTAKVAFTASLDDARFDGQIENLTLLGIANINATGNVLDNTLIGNSGNNILDGNIGIDLLFGDAGNDTLIGGLGADILTGGDGLDVFLYRLSSESSAGAWDVITDFMDGDKIDLTAIDANDSLAGNQAFNFIGVDVAFSGVAGQLRFDSASHILSADINGNGSSDFNIGLAGIGSVTSSNFKL